MIRQRQYKSSDVREAQHQLSRPALSNAPSLKSHSKVTRPWPVDNDNWDCVITLYHLFCANSDFSRYCLGRRHYGLGLEGFGTGVTSSEARRTCQLTDEKEERKLHAKSCRANRDLPSPAMSAEDYPDYLNPFDENYNGIPEPRIGKQKYNTWGTKKGKQVESKPTFLQRPWAALNITPKGKLVRRLSVLKTSVERMSFRRKRAQPPDSLPRSHSIHEDLSFRIVSPKVKAKLREQAFPALARMDSNSPPDESAVPPEVDSYPEINGRLSLPSETEYKDSLTHNTTHPPNYPELEAPQPQPRRRRKKQPPPPPPPTQLPLVTTELLNGVDKPSEDNVSNRSSITQDLEKGASSEEDSLAEFEFDQQKLNSQYD